METEAKADQDPVQLAACLLSCEAAIDGVRIRDDPFASGTRGWMDGMFPSRIKGGRA